LLVFLLLSLVGVDVALSVLASGCCLLDDSSLTAGEELLRDAGASLEILGFEGILSRLLDTDDLLRSTSSRLIDPSLVV